MIPEEVESSIARALRGDQTGYAALYEVFATGIYRLCYSLLFNREDAEDVMQETFVYAFRNLHRYDSKLSTLKTWLYTIAICRCRNMYRKRQLPTCDLAPFLQNGLPAPKSETPEAALARQSAREAVERALASLSPRLREARLLPAGSRQILFRQTARARRLSIRTGELPCGVFWVGLRRAWAS